MHQKTSSESKVLLEDTDEQRHQLVSLKSKQLGNFITFQLYY